MKASEYYRKIKPDRDAWREEVAPSGCMCCGRHLMAELMDVHEITPRSQAPNRWWHRCNALYLCRECHGRIGSKPAAFQLAVKFVKNHSEFDLAKWLLVGRPDGTAEFRVTMEDIVSYLRVDV